MMQRRRTIFVVRDDGSTVGPNEERHHREIPRVWFAKTRMRPHSAVKWQVAIGAEQLCCVRCHVENRLHVVNTGRRSHVRSFDSQPEHMQVVNIRPLVLLFRIRICLPQIQLTLDDLTRSRCHPQTERGCGRIG